MTDLPPVLTKEKVLELMEAAVPGAARLNRQLRSMSRMSWRARTIPLR